MKKLQALLLVLVLCFTLAVPAFAADKQYEQITIDSITFEAAYTETATLRFVELYNLENLVEKTVTLCVVKPGSQITITDGKGKTVPERQVGTWWYDKEHQAYEEGWANVLCTGQSDSAFSPLTTSGLVQLSNDCFLKLGDSSTPTKPADPIVGSFTDVKADSYYAEAVQWAVDCKITEGTSTTTFSPDQTCTNAQILTFMWRSTNISTDMDKDDDDPYYTKAVLWASLMNMIDASEFDPDKPCTRAVTMEYFWKMVGSPKTELTGKFTDVSADAPYAQAVAWAVENGITLGTSGTTFSPNETCTRGQIVTFLHRVLK